MSLNSPSKSCTSKDCSSCQTPFDDKPFGQPDVDGCVDESASAAGDDALEEDERPDLWKCTKRRQREGSVVDSEQAD